MSEQDKQYDLYADKYDLLLNATPYRPYIEAYTFFDVLGEISQRSVLDMATGTGYYARACAKLGANKVVGIDISEQMIRVAKDAETSEPFGITYHTSDATTFKATEPFDLVIAVYLLHYSSSLEILQLMCNNIAANVKPDGRFVTYQFNPQFTQVEGYHQKYGLTITPVPLYQDGEELQMQLNIGGETIPTVTIYRWDTDTIETTLKNAGFKSVKWHAPKLSPKWQDTSDDAGFFDDYLSHPHAVVLEANM